MAMPEVLIVGAGPVGTLLAAELTRFGVGVELLERRPAAGGGSRAIGLHAPTLAALEAGGATERILSRAVRVRRGEARSDGRALGVVDFGRLDVRHPYVATLPQAETEVALRGSGPEPERGATVTRITPDGRRVRVETDRGGRVAPIVVVAGGVGVRELVYRPGALRRTAYPDRYLMTDAALPPREDAETALVHLAPGGVLESFPLPDGQRRFVVWDEGGSLEPHELAGRLRRAMRERGEPEAAEVVTEATAFGVRRVLVPAMRRDRLFVIGDAAHEISPIGGQGLNLGLLDAATLAPLLAAWVRLGEAPEPDLVEWERDRLRSARTAGRMAAVNMRLGRPVSVAAHAVRSRVLGSVLAATGSLVPHAYAMGLDAAAR
ncbi:Pentachlorophenol 4-monooxygenase [Microbacterium oleivorans]|uniref:FAD-dependent oxidoreductase n=1 Tax=Microbacterium oleivorans TaxID=273677 RepID=UPI000F8F877E|nr:NAD(P)/FAD-dependent oxidoreductase [Microbacterium oleivorans]AZS45103.1 Pentachlorophenol 4-monooxygenase [Microbacterium oleivorans]